MNTNHSQAESWINSAINDIKRAIKSYKARDYSDFAFRSQFAVEKINKAILSYFGLKIEKTHIPHRKF